GSGTLNRNALPCFGVAAIVRLRLQWRECSSSVSSTAPRPKLVHRSRSRGVPTNSPPLLDFERLLNPIAGASPSGSTLPYTVRSQLEAFRREVNPDDYDEGDPQRPTAAKPADWPAIIELSQKVLQEISKDLSVAARLTEAMVKQYGFAG